MSYNIRFRQRDWIHRIFVFLQLLVFGALAAFTNNFDITVGLSNGPDPDQTLLTQLEIQNDGFSTQDITAQQFRNDRLPIQNDRGISIVLGLSRALLLAQYLVGTS